MTAYTVNANHVAVEPWTMTANQIDSVTFTANFGRVQVVSDGVAEVRVTIDGSDPTFAAAGASTVCFRLPAGAIGRFDFPLVLTTDVVKLLSTGTPKVSVQVVV